MRTCSTIPRQPTRGTLVEWHSELGISHPASMAEIKEAYQRRVLQCHPDHGGSDASFRRTLEAYRSLLQAKCTSASSASHPPFAAWDASSQCQADTNVTLSSLRWCRGSKQSIRWRPLGSSRSSAQVA